MSKLLNVLKKVVARPNPEMFLPPKLIMIDCEMTGVVPERDHLLQVAMLKLELKNNQYVEIGEPLVEYLGYPGKPMNEFQKQYLMQIIDKCNQSRLKPCDLKNKISKWLGSDAGKVMPCGDCIPTDIAFLYSKGCIERPDICDKGSIPGTFHYEFFDLNAIKAIARQKTGAKEKLELDENIHDALVDCRNQTKELNHFLAILLA